MRPTLSACSPERAEEDLRAGGHRPPPAVVAERADHAERSALGGPVRERSGAELERWWFRAAQGKGATETAGRQESDDNPPLPECVAKAFVPLGMQSRGRAVLIQLMWTVFGWRSNDD